VGLGTHRMYDERGPLGDTESGQGRD